MLPQAAGHCSSMNEASLCAHAHLLHGELLLESAGSEKLHSRLQRVAWHIERARLALHSTGSVGVATCVLLVHLHILQAKLRGQGNGAPRRQAEQALDELVSGCRTIDAGWLQ